MDFSWWMNLTWQMVAFLATIMLDLARKRFLSKVFSFVHFPRMYSTMQNIYNVGGFFFLLLLSFQEFPKWLFISTEIRFIGKTQVPFALVVANVMRVQKCFWWVFLFISIFLQLLLSTMCVCMCVLLNLIRSFWRLLCCFRRFTLTFIIEHFDWNAPRILHCE